MAKLAKFLQGVAGAAGGAGLNVEEVFSTYLYEGTGAAQTITNGIDLDGEGGLLWLKVRDQNRQHWLVDSERDLDDGLSSNETSPYIGYTNRVNSFNTNGFTVGTQEETNANGEDYVSWTFRKAPKFFDVVTYTGNGSSTRNISHNLESTPHFIIVKCTSHSTYWAASHWNQSGTRKVMSLNTTSAVNGTNTYQDGYIHSRNSTTFTAFANNVTDMDAVNASGRTYVAYLFAHNDGDGEFGPTGDQDIIKCGSFSASSAGYVDLGFEPQWFIYKRTDNTSNWAILDAMRGFYSDADGTRFINANTSDAENDSGNIRLTSNGFYHGALNGTWVYIAIRRGPMAVPEDATDVFAMDFRFSSEAQALNPEQQYYSGFPVDMHLNLRRSGGGVYAYSRLQGGSNFLRTSTTDAEVSSTTNQFGSNEGLYPLGFTNTEDTTTLGHMFRRAPNFFDVVAYTGTGSTMTINHNLGVTPEMIWTKRRDSTGSWLVYHSATGLNKYLFLNSTAAVGSSGNYYAVSDTTFGAPFVNSGGTFISYLFASVDGVSKVGSYTGDGTTGRVIDCGFSSGARFVLIKVTSHTGDWWLFDTERGITTSVAYGLRLNDTAAEVPSGSPTQDYHDRIDPSSSGFIVNHTSAIGVNESGKDYIFYAIA